MGEPKVVYLLTTGDGDDGDPWNVVGVFLTRQAAEKAQFNYEANNGRMTNDLEEWPLLG